MQQGRAKCILGVVASSIEQDRLHMIKQCLCAWNVEKEGKLYWENMTRTLLVR